MWVWEQCWCGRAAVKSCESCQRCGELSVVACGLEGCVCNDSACESGGRV